jgi:methylmalonyl-CoA/ethylmalonyl-CoA epimerase
MKKIEHLGIAVKNLEESEKLFESLLNTHVYKREYVEEQKVTTSFLRAGNNKIELLKASSSDSVINKFIEKRGEGLHHIAFSVSDIRYEMARLTKEGFTLLSEEPQNGADNKLVCFLHPKEANGLLVELVQDAD